MILERNKKGKLELPRKEWVRDLNDPNKWYEVSWKVIIDRDKKGVTYLPRSWKEI